MRNSAGVTPSLRKFIFERDGLACKHCGVLGYARKRPSRGYAYPTEKAGVSLTIDHVIPKSKGGTNDPTNLQTLCHDCNRIKGAK